MENPKFKMRLGHISETPSENDLNREFQILNDEIQEESRIEKTNTYFAVKRDDALPCLPPEATLVIITTQNPEILVSAYNLIKTLKGLNINHISTTGGKEVEINVDGEFSGDLVVNNRDSEIQIKDSTSDNE